MGDSSVSRLLVLLVQSADLVVAFQYQLSFTVSAIEIDRRFSWQGAHSLKLSAVLAAADLDPNLPRYSVLI